MFPTRILIALVSLASLVVAAPFNETVARPRKIGKRCTGTISSLSDVSSAVECTTININAFTVPGGSTYIPSLCHTGFLYFEDTFEIDAADGTTINLNGDISFAYEVDSTLFIPCPSSTGEQQAWAGPLMILKGDSVTFNGNGHSLKGNGDQYWVRARYGTLSLPS
jgi:polygalacturonase